MTFGRRRMIAPVARRWTVVLFMIIASIGVTLPASAQPIETDCDDLIDNDQDGELDCADLDCCGVAPCDCGEGFPSFDPNYVIALSTAFNIPGQPATVVASIETVLDPASGWSLGVCHDAGGLILLSAQTALSATNPEYDSVTFSLEGWTQGVVLCFMGCAVLGPGGTPLISGTADYLVDPSATLSSFLPVHYCDTIVAPVSGVPIKTLLVVDQAGSTFDVGVSPLRDSGGIYVGTELPGSPIFIRGDCNIDGSTNIADAITILDVLFVGTSTASCLDACDNNDDGGFNIADGIYLLTSLFAGGLPPLPPISACGGDPTTGDPLDCASFGGC